MMTMWTKSGVAKLLLAGYIISPALVIADCIGPPSMPILEIAIRSCEVAPQFDSTLRINGNPRQVLTMFHSYATTSGNVEFVLADNLMPEQSFWISVAPGEGCKEFLEKAEKIWLFGDICNDTGQNIPNIQIMPLWTEVKQIALTKLAERPSGAT